MSNLKVATFNIDKDNGIFPDRIYNLSNIIYKNRFDIICIQEDYNSKKFSSGKFLNLELDYNYISIKTRVKERHSTLSSSNLTILSKYKITLLDELFFNKGKEEERAAVFIKLNFEGKKILLVNAHLCHLNSQRRVEQINMILKKIKSYKGFDTVILCGDFNALPFYKEIKMIEEDGFTNKNSEFTHEDKVILDYIFLKSKKRFDIESKVILKGFSDHNCLLNIFKFY